MSSSGAGDKKDVNTNDGNESVPVQGNNPNDGGDQTPPPPPQPEPAAERSVAKTARTPQKGGEEGSSSKPKKKTDPGGKPRTVAVFDAPETPPPCEVCSKVFPSWKSLFGHMRSHPERSWRGVKPPPVFTPPGSPENPPEPTLLQIVEQMLGPTDTEKEGSVTDDNIGMVTRGALADFDLNDPMEAAPEEEVKPWPKRQRTFDLNMPAPEDDDDDAGDQ